MALLVAVFLFVSSSLPRSASALDITSVDIRLVSQFNSTSDSIVSSLAPTFALGQYGPMYVMPQVYYVNASVEFRIVFSTANSVTIDRGAGTSALLPTVVSATWTTPFDLNSTSPASSTFRVKSTVDSGIYSFLFQRAPALLTSLSFRSATAAIDLLLPPTLDPALGLATGNTLTYNVNFYSSSASCFINTLGFSVENNSSLLTTLNYQSGQALVVECNTKTLDIGVNGLPAFLTTSFTLAYKNNVMRLKVPTDGWYTINLWRYQGTWTINNAPTSLYTHQVVNSWTFQPTTIPGATITITPTCATPGVVFSPTTLSWTGLIAQALSITAPPTAGNITVVFQFDGRDARLFNPIPPQAIVIKAQGTFTLSSIPPSIFSQQWSPIPFTIAPTAVPDALLASGCRILINSTAGPGSWDPNVIVFPPGYSSPQTLRFQGQSFNVEDYTTVTLTVDPTTAIQFVYQQTVQVYTYPLASLLVSGFETLFRSGETRLISFSLSTGPINPTDGSPSYVTLLLAAGNGTWDTQSLLFNDGQALTASYTAPHFFLAGPDDVQNDTVVVSFQTDPLSDYAHFIPPPVIGVPVLSQAHLVFQSAVRVTPIDTSFTFSVAASHQPVMTVDGQYFSAVPGLNSFGSINPMVLTFEAANWNAPQSMTYQAPSIAAVVPLYTGFAFRDGPSAWQYVNDPRLDPPTVTVKALCAYTTPPVTMFTNQQMTLIVTITGLIDQHDLQIGLDSPSRANYSTLLSTTQLDFASAIGTGRTFDRSFLLTAPPALPLIGIGGNLVSINLALSGTDSNLVFPPSPSTFSFTVLPQSTLTVTGAPTKLYANQVSASMTIAFGEPITSGITGPALSIEVRPTVVSGAQAGTVGPKQYYNLTSGYAAPITFAYTAGALPGTVSLGLVLGAKDAPHYLVSPAAIPIAILAQGTFLVTGLPATAKVNVQTAIPLRVSLNQAPVTEAPYTGTVTLTLGTSGGALDVTTLTFNTANWATPQSVMLTAPSLAQVFTVTWLVGGSNAPQFQAPAPLSLTALATLTYTPPDVLALYTNQFLGVLTFLVSGVASPHVTLTATLFPPIGVISATAIDLGAGIALINYTAPATVAASNPPVSVSITFGLVANSDAQGAIDLAKFGTPTVIPPPLSFTITPQSSFLFGGRFDSLRVNEQSGALTLQPLASVGTNGFTLQLNLDTTENAPSDDNLKPYFTLVSGSTDSEQPQAITFRSGTPTVQTFYLVAGSVGATVVVSFAFDTTSPGADIYHFALPPPFTVTVNPLGTYQILLPLNMFYGQSALLSYNPSITPMNGIRLSPTLQVASVGVLTRSVNGVLVGTGGPSVDLNWVGTNALQQVLFGATDAPASTTVTGLATFNYPVHNDPLIDADIGNIPMPTAQSLLLLPHGGWKISNLPIQIGLGPDNAWTVSLMPTLGMTGEVRLSLSATSGTITPAYQSWTTPNVAKEFVFTAFTSGTVNITATQSLMSGTTALLQPAPFRVIVVAPITITPPAGKEMPSFLYSQQVSDLLIITPSPLASITPRSGLTVTFSSNSSSSAPYGFPSGVVPKVIFAPASVSFINSNPLQFSIQAPIVTVAQGEITAFITFGLSDFASPQYLAPTPISIRIRPQSVLTIQYLGASDAFISNGTNPSLYAFTTVSWKVTQTDVSDAGGFKFNILSDAPSALSQTLFLFTGGQLNAQTFTYTAPLTIQSRTTITFTATEADAAHFKMPDPIVFGLLGPLLLPGCTATQQNVIVSGAPDGTTALGTVYFNGLYTVAAPIGRMPHYSLATTIGGTTTIVHLFYLLAASCPPLWNLPAGLVGVWLLDVDTSVFSAHPQALYTFASSPLLRPGGVQQSAITWLSGSTSAVIPGVLVSCGVDCGLLGTSTSLEASLCFNGASLLTTTPAAPTVCPVSCGHFINGIVATCQPLTWQPAVSVPVLQMQTQCGSGAAAPSCLYARTMSVAQTCGIQQADGDVAWDLTNSMQFPAACSSACAAVWTAYALQCVSTVPGSPVAQFTAACASTSYLASPSTLKLLPVGAPTFADVHSDHLNVGWSWLGSTASVTPLMRFDVQYATSAAALTNTQTIAPMIAVTEYVATLTNLAAQTAYFVRVRATPAGVAGATDVVFTDWSVVSSITTPPAPLSPAQTSATQSILMTYVASSAGVPSTFNALVSWSPVQPFGLGPTVYRVTMSRTVGGSISPLYNTIQVYAGTDTSGVIQGITPFIPVAFQVTSADPSVSTAHDNTGPILPATFATGSASVVTPDVVSIYPIGDPSATDITFGWQSPTCYSSTTTSACIGVSFLLEFQSTPTRSLVPGPIGGGVGSGLSFLPASSWIVDTAWTDCFTCASTSTTLPTTVVFNAAAGYNPTADRTWAFRVRTQAFGSSLKPSPYSLPLIVTPPPTLATIASAQTDFQFVSVNYQTVVASWNPLTGITTAALAPADFLHVVFTPLLAASGAVVPSASTPVIHFYFEIDLLLVDAYSNLELSFSSTTALNNIPFSYATNYTLSWELHTSGLGALVAGAGGTGWSGLQGTMVNDPTAGVSAPATISIPDAPPALVAITASDPYQSRTSLLGAQLSFVFSKPTTRPTVTTAAQFASLLACTPAIPSGTLFSPSWASDTVLALNFLSSSGGPEPGVFTCSIASSQIMAPAVPAGFVSAGDSLSTLIDRAGLTATFAGALSEGNLARLQPYYSPVPVPSDSVRFPLVYPSTPSLLRASASPSALFVIVTFEVVGNVGSLLTYPIGTGTPARTITVGNLRYSQLLDHAQSPLMFGGVGFTPLAKYAGIDAVRVTLTQNATGDPKAESMTIVLSVNQINHAPVITSLFSQLASPMPIGPGPVSMGSTAFQISDPDDPAGALPIKVTLSAGPSLTAQFMLTIPTPAGVTSTALPHVPVPSITFTGLAAADVDDMLAATTFWDPAADASYPSTSNYIEVCADDGGSGIRGAAARFTVLTVYYAAMPRGQDGTMPTVKSTVFTADFTEVVFMFDSAVRINGDVQLTVDKLTTGGNTIPDGHYTPLAGPSYSCASLFDATTVALLGVDPRCVLSPATTLRVLLGYSSAVTPTTPLTFLASTLGKSGAATSWLFGSYTPALPSPAVAAAFQPPVVRLFGQSNISLCDDLVVYSQVANSSLHALLFYWSASPTSLLPGVVDQRAPTLYVPGAWMHASQAYRIQLYTVNRWTGQRSNTATWNVMKSAIAAPQLSVIGESIRMVTRGDIVQLAVAAAPSACMTGVSSSDRISFQWTISPPLATGLMDPAAFTQRTLTIPPLVLASTVAAYTLTCTASMASAPTVATSVQVTINMTPAPLQVYILGGAAQTVAAAASIALTASAWDPEQSALSAFAVSWSCAQALSPLIASPSQPQACFHALTKVSLMSSVLAGYASMTANAASNATSALVLPVGTLAPGAYVFSASTTKSSRLPGAYSVTVFVASSPSSPTLTVTPSSQVVNPADPLVLSAGVTGALAGQYSYLWSIAPGTAIVPSFIDPTLTSGWATPILSINIGVSGTPRSALAFPPGAKFRIRCTVTDRTTGASSNGESEITVTNPPAGGIFQVTPATGVSGSLFNFSAVGFRSSFLTGGGSIGGGSVGGSSMTNVGFTYRYYLRISDRPGGLVPLGAQPGSITDSETLFLPANATTAQTLRLVLRVSTAGGVYALYSTTVVVTPNPTYGGGSLLSLSGSFLSARLTGGSAYGGSEAAASAYLQMFAISTASILQLGTSTASTAWPVAGHPINLQARCNILQSGALSATPINSSLGLGTINTMAPLAAATLSPYAYAAKQAYTLLVAQYSSLHDSQPGVVLKLCTTLVLAAQLAPFAGVWSVDMSNTLTTICNSMVTITTGASGTQSSAAYGSGNRFALALVSYGCGSSNWPMYREASICYAAKTQLIRDLLLITHSTWSLRRFGLASPFASSVPSDEPGFVSAWLAQLSSILDMHARYLFQAATPTLVNLIAGGAASAAQSVPTALHTYPDCLFSSQVVRTQVGATIGMTFGTTDNTTVAALVANAAPSSITSSLSNGTQQGFLDTRIVSMRVNPYAAYGVVPNSFGLLSSVVLVQQRSTVASALSPILTVGLPYSGVACNPVCAACNYTACLQCNLACLPTCLRWEPSTSAWMLDSSITTSSHLLISPREPNALVAECRIAVGASAGAAPAGGGASLDLTIGLFAATPAFNGIAWPPAGYPISSSTGSSSTSQSSTGGASSSTGGGSSSSSTGGSSADVMVPSSSSTGGSSPTPTLAIAVHSTLQLRLPYQNVSSPTADAEFRYQLKRDLAMGTGVETTRILVRGVAPSGIVQVQEVSLAADAPLVKTWVRRDALASNSSSLANATSPSNTTAPANHTTVITSTETTVEVTVLPSTVRTLVTPEAFQSIVAQQVASRTGSLYSGVYTRYLFRANFSSQQVALCSDGTYQIDCGTNVIPPAAGSSSSSPTLFGLPLGAGIGIIVGALVLAATVGLIIYCLFKSRRTESDFSKKSPEEKEEIIQRALEKKLASTKAAEEKLHKKLRQAKEQKRKEREKAREKAQANGLKIADDLDSDDDDGVTHESGNGSGPQSTLASPSRSGAAGSGRRHAPPIDLPNIEPQWESAIYVPQTLRKTAAIVTARTAGHEEEPNQQQFAMRTGGDFDGMGDPPGGGGANRNKKSRLANANNRNQLASPSAKGRLGSGETDQYSAMASASEPSDHYVVSPEVIQGERRPLGGAVPRADPSARQRRQLPVSAGAIGYGQVSSQSRQAQMERGRAEAAAAQQAQQQQRMNSPSAYAPQRAHQQQHGIAVSGPAPVRLASGQRQQAHPSPMSTRPPTRTGALRSPTSARLTPAQLAAQVMYHSMYADTNNAPR